MSALDDNIIKHRVLVDWDGDGYMNLGVPTGTPPNLFPQPLYVNGSYIKGFTGAGVEVAPTDTPSQTEHSFLKRGVRLGDSALTVSFALKGFTDYQPQIGDPDNLLLGNPSRAQFFINNSPIDAYYQKTGQLSTGTAGAGLLSEAPVINDNGKIGERMLKIPYDSTRAACLLALGAFDGSTIYNAQGYGAVNFSNAFTGVPNYRGIPVAGSTTYTLIAQVYVPKTSVNQALPTGTPELRLAVYGNLSAANGSGSPHYDRDFLNWRTGGVTQDAWNSILITFTTQAANTNVYLDLQMYNSMQGEIYLGGLMLLPGTVSAPSRFWDNAIVFSDTQFSAVIPDDNSPYVLSYHVRSPNGITLLTPTLNTVEIGTNDVVQTSPATVAVTSSWKKVDVPISADTVNRGVWLTFTAEKGGSPVGALNAGDIEFSGFQLTAGSTGYPFHAGDAYGLEDITDYVLSVRTELGKRDFLSELPDEGTLTCVVDNSTRRFSPSNTTGVLFGKLRPNLRVILQLWDVTNSAWKTMWSGWTQNFPVDAGRNKSNRAEITAVQGLFRLADGTLYIPILHDTTMDVVAKTIVENSGYRSPDTTLQSFVGVGTLAGVNAYVMDTSLLYNIVEPGINAIELSGKDWASDTDPRRALSDVLGAENGQMWIDRNGRISIVNRNHWITDVKDGSFLLDTEAVKAQYEYGQNIINAAEVKLARNKLLTDQTVWATKRPIRLSPNQVWVVELNPQFTEGRNKTVVEYTLDGMTKDVYTKDNGLIQTTENQATAEQANLVYVELLGEPGKRPKLRVTNANNTVLFVNVEIKGNYVDVGDTEIVKVENKASIESQQARYLKTYSNPLLTTTMQAESWGEFVLLQRDEAKGEFTSVSFMVRNVADLDRVHSLTIGDVVDVSEGQSGEVGLYHTIIGEEIEIDNSRTLTISYRMARTLQEEFAKADVTILEDTPFNLVRDIYNAETFGSGGVITKESGTQYGLRNVLRWRTGMAWFPRLLLSPAREQLRVFNPVLDAKSWPLTDASGNPFTPAPTVSGVAKVASAQFAPAWVVPLGNTDILWFTPNATRQLMTATGTALTVVGGTRSKTTDEAVGAAAKYTNRIPVTPMAKYEVRSYALLMNGSNPSGQVIEMLDRNGTMLEYINGTPNTTSTPSTVLDASSSPRESMKSLFHQFRASSGGVGVDMTSAKVYKKANVFEPEGLMRMEILRMSDNRFFGGVPLDSAETHYVTVYLLLGARWIAPTDMRINIYSDNDGAFIATDSGTLTPGSVLKLQTTITGHDGISVHLYCDHTIIDADIIVLAHGITLTDPTSYVELATLTDRDLVYV